MKKPVVALLGRPNVGKSTIFNRLVGKKISIIEDTPGITRDRIYGNVEYNDNTGMIEISKTELLSKEIDFEKYKSETERKIYVFEKGTYLYNGPSKAYGIVDENIEIPVGTILKYVYGDEAWAYVEYNNIKGWVYIYIHTMILYMKKELK